MADEQVETQEETQVETLTEAEQKAQVQALLETQPEETQETVQSSNEQIEQTETQETKEEATQEPTINDELVEQFPQLKMYRGKLIKDLAPAYANLVGKLHEVIKLNNELKGKLEKTSLDELGEPPDPIEHRKDFDEWLEKRDKLIKSQIPESKPEPINHLAIVQTKLPEGIDAQKVADGWAKFNSVRLFNETGNLRPELQKLYQEHPEIMIDEILNFYHLSSKANQNEFAITKQAKEQAYQQTKENFRQAQKTKKETSEARAIKRTVESTPEDEILTTIYKLAQTG